MPILPACLPPFVLLRVPAVARPVPRSRPPALTCLAPAPGIWCLVMSRVGQPVVAIVRGREGRLLTARWLGNSTPENVLVGAQRLVRLAGRLRVRAILSDGSRSGGDWSDVLPLIEYELLPVLAAMGLRGVALVSSAFAPSQLALRELANVASGQLNTCLFDTVQPARDWLDEVLDRLP